MFYFLRFCLFHLEICTIPSFSSDPSFFIMKCTKLLHFRLIYKYPKICPFYRFSFLYMQKYFLFCRCCSFIEKYAKIRHFLQIWSFTFRNMEEFVIFFIFCLFSCRNMWKCFIFVRFCLLYLQICCIFFRFCFLYAKMFHFLLILLSYVQIWKNA